MSQEQNQNQINIELNEETAEGTYANLAIIQHSSSEFVLDFIRIMPGVPKGRVKSRIVMSPEHAKKLMRALGENIAKHENTFGLIREDNSQQGFPLNFGTPTTEA